MKINVIKFGGSSLKDAASMEMAVMRVLEHLHCADAVVVIVSAMGRFPSAYATDTLASFSTHLTPKDKDRLMCLGEVISSLVFLNCCRAKQVNACALSIQETGIISDDHFQKGYVLKVSNTHLKKALERHDVVIVPGFTASSCTGNMVTLGRGGSDYSAFLIADALDVPFVSIYTDVSGVYDKDPKNHVDASVYQQVCASVLLELIDQGAKVMQKESVLFAVKKNIEFEVRSTFDGKKGTIVKMDPSASKLHQQTDN